MHVNEQTLGGLRRALRKARLRPAEVWRGDWVHTEHLPDGEGARVYRRLARTPGLRGLGAANLFALGDQAVTYAIDDLAELKEYLGDDYDQGRWSAGTARIEEEFERARRRGGAVPHVAGLPLRPDRLRDVGHEAALPRAAAAPRPAGRADARLRLRHRRRRPAPARGAATTSRSPTSTTRPREFLRWRLERRGLQAPVYDLEHDEIPAGFDATFAFDVIEHVDDPFAFLGRMESLARLVRGQLARVAARGGREPAAPRPPDHASCSHARPRRAPFAYERHHKRSHLVLYGPGSAAAPSAPCGSRACASSGCSPSRAGAQLS